MRSIRLCTSSLQYFSGLSVLNLMVNPTRWSVVAVAERMVPKNLSMASCWFSIIEMSNYSLCCEEALGGRATGEGVTMIPNARIYEELTK